MVFEHDEIRCRRGKLDIDGGGQRSEGIVGDQSHVEALGHGGDFLGLADSTCQADIGLDVVACLTHKQISKLELGVKALAGRDGYRNPGLEVG